MKNNNLLAIKEILEHTRKYLSDVIQNNNQYFDDSWFKAILRQAGENNIALRGLNEKINKINKKKNGK